MDPSAGDRLVARRTPCEGRIDTATCTTCGNWMPLSQAARVEFECPDCGGDMEVGEFASEAIHLDKLGYPEELPEPPAARSSGGHDDAGHYADVFYRGFRIGCPIAPILMLSVVVAVVLWTA